MDLRQKLKKNGIKQVEIAREFGVTKVAINAWMRNGVPVKYCERLETYTQGKISRRDMRPKDYAEIWPSLHNSVKQE